jgi:hypothetical protein
MLKYNIQYNNNNNNNNNLYDQLLVERTFACPNHSESFASNRDRVTNARMVSVKGQTKCNPW